MDGKSLVEDGQHSEYTGLQFNWKRTGAYVLATGILTFALNLPTWEIQMAFKNAHPRATANARLLENPLLQSASPWLSSHNQTFFDLQPLAVSQGPILATLQSALAKEGILTPSANELKQKIRPRLNTGRNELDITIHSADLNTTERVGTHLNYLYQKALDTYQQHITAQQRDLIEAAMMYRSAQREAGTQWMAANLQAEALEEINSPSKLNDLGAEKLHTQYTRLETLGAVQRDIQSKGTAREAFYLGLLPQSTQKAFQSVLDKPSSTINAHVDKLANTTLKALLLSLTVSEASPEWLDMQDEVAANAHELNEDSHALAETLLSLLPTESRDDVTQSLVQAIADNHLQRALAEQGYTLTQTAFTRTLSDIDALAPYIGAYQTWNLKRNWLDASVNQLARELDTADPRTGQPVTAKETGIIQPIKHYHILEWLGSWLVLLALPGLLRRLARKVSNVRFKQISTMSWTRLLQTLTQSSKPQITLLLPQGEHHNAQVALNLSSSLTRCGRHTLVLDIDVYHRQLSQLLPEVAANGLLHHLLDASLANPYTLPGSDANIIPIEASLNSATSGNFRQILNRLPQVWQRWTKSHIVLDAARWYPVYETLLPYVDRVIAYPSETQDRPSPSSLTPPWALFNKQNIAVTRLENLPTLKLALDEAGLDSLDRRLNPIVDR